MEVEELCFYLELVYKNKFQDLLEVFKVNRLYSFLRSMKLLKKYIKDWDLHS